jgi:hypothetical protein
MKFRFHTVIRRKKTEMRLVDLQLIQDAEFCCNKNLVPFFKHATLGANEDINLSLQFTLGNIFSAGYELAAL